MRHDLSVDCPRPASSTRERSSALQPREKLFPHEPDRSPSGAKGATDTISSRIPPVGTVERPLQTSRSRRLCVREHPRGRSEVSSLVVHHSGRTAPPGASRRQTPSTSAWLFDHRSFGERQSGPVKYDSTGEGPASPNPRVSRGSSSRGASDCTETGRDMRWRHCWRERSNGG